MAGEIGYTVSFSLLNGNLTGSVGSISVTDDQATSGWMQFQRTVTFAAELDITFPDIVTNGWLVIKNLDLTNYVKWGPKSTTMVEMGRIKALKTAGPIFVSPGVVLRMQADTANVKCEFSFTNA